MGSSQYNKNKNDKSNTDRTKEDKHDNDHISNKNNHK
ncbi:hypothetical protein CDLVIII_3480 [Clostridium sp. DL-VIII]|nr:hypothetical protein CDLVIII_3480 [Clostridium sp. DL-VIII]